MTFFYFNVKRIRRALGSSAVGAAAYRSASRLYDERQGRWHNYADKPGVVWSRILTPEAHAWAGEDRSRFWNGVEAFERRANAVVATEVLFALPTVLPLETCIALSSAYLKREFCDNDLVVDLNLHEAQSERGVNLHAHALVSTRSLDVKPGETGFVFGLKRADIFDLRHLYDWRRSLAEHANTALAEAGVDLQLDPRSYKSRGVRLEPGIKVGAAAAGLRSRGRAANRAQDNDEVALRNGDRIIADPTIALEALAQERSTFRRLDLDRFLATHCFDEEQRRLAAFAVEASPERIRVGRDASGEERFTLRELVTLEALLTSQARRLHETEPGRLEILPETGLSGGDPLRKMAEALHLRNLPLAGAALSRMAAEDLQARIQAPVHVITLDGAPAFGQTPPPGALTLFVVAQADLMTARQLRPLIETGLQAQAAMILLTGPPRERGPIGAALRAVGEGLTRREAGLAQTVDLNAAAAAFAARRGFVFERSRIQRPDLAERRAGAETRFSHRVLRGFAEAELSAARPAEDPASFVSAQNAARRARDRLEILWPGAGRRLEGTEAGLAPGLAAAVGGRTDALKRLVEDRGADADQEAERREARRPGDLDR